MKKILILALTLFAGTQTADACSYIYRTPEEKLAAADAVFVGKVIDVTTSEVVPLPGPNGEMSEFGNTSTSKTSFQATKSWKGNVSGVVDIYSSHSVGSSCSSFKGAVGHEYVVFANYSTSTARYTVTEIGAEDTSFSEAQKSLAVLNKTITTPSVTSFNVNLRVGTRHMDVKRLQIFLNRLGFPVAEKGVGSFGQEGTYFGVQTMRALTEFQNAFKTKLNIIAGTGYFGPSTRMYFNNNLNNL